jgi:hypothetical protein
MKKIWDEKRIRDVQINIFGNDDDDDDCSVSDYMETAYAFDAFIKKTKELKNLSQEEKDKLEVTWVAPDLPSSCHIKYKKSIKQITEFINEDGHIRYKFILFDGTIFYGAPWGNEIAPNAANNPKEYSSCIDEYLIENNLLDKF